MVIILKHLIVIFCGIILFSTQSYSEAVSISVPSAVSDTINMYRAECTDEGGELELDGDDCHTARLRNRPPRLKLVLSDSAYLFII